MMALKDARWGTFAETGSSNNKIDEAQLKRISGDDVMVGHGDSLTFKALNDRHL